MYVILGISVIIIIIILLLLALIADDNRKKTINMSDVHASTCKDAETLYEDLGLHPPCVEEEVLCTVTQVGNNKCGSEITPTPGYKVNDDGKEGDCCIWDLATDEKSPEAIRKELLISSMKLMGHVTMALVSYKLMKAMVKKLGKSAAKKMGVTIGKNVMKRVMISIAKKISLKIAEKMAAKLAMAGATAMVFPVGTALAVLKLMGAIFEAVFDVGGYHKYMDNKDMIMMVRDQYEGTVLNQGVLNQTDSPLLFVLVALKSLVDYENIPEFKSICEIFSEGHGAYVVTMMEEVLETLSTEKGTVMLNHVIDALKHDKEPPKEFYDALTETGDKYPHKRDAYIWNYMEDHGDLGITGNEGTYVVYKPQISADDRIGISLNKAGCEKYNQETTKQAAAHPDKPGHYLAYTRYYRNINKVITNSDGGKQFEMKQMAMPTEFATISPSYGVVKLLCEQGVSKEMLKTMYPIQKAMDIGVDQIHPSDYLTSYDVDTGLCKYDMSNKRKWDDTGWCRRMDAGWP